MTTDAPPAAEPSRPNCGDRLGKHTCQRSPHHTYPHRDAKQKGTETSSWWAGQDRTR